MSRIIRSCIAVLITAAVLSGCKANPQAPASATTDPANAPVEPAPAAAMPENAASAYIAGHTYTYHLDRDADAKGLSAVATKYGVAWSPPQPTTDTGGKGHPTAPATVYLTPFKPEGGDLADGSTALLTLPLTVQDNGNERYVTAFGLFDAGDWLVIESSGWIPGTGGADIYLDAVNLKTNATRRITTGHIGGGRQLNFDAMPNTVYWERWHVIPTGNALDEAVTMDLDTGETRQGRAPGSGLLPAATATADQLAPFFQATHGPVPGVFVRKDGKLTYVEGDRRLELALGRDPVALVSGDTAVLLSDDQGLSWFNWKTGELTRIPGLPKASQAACQGNTYALVSGSRLLTWRPGESPQSLTSPANLRNVIGLSMAPGGRYLAAAFDLSPSDRHRSEAVWTYDLKTGAVMKHSFDVPADAREDRLQFLGWTDSQTLRFVEFEDGSWHGWVGFTWRLSEAAPAFDGTRYTIVPPIAVSTDGGWFMQFSAPPTVQSVRPDSVPFGLPFPAQAGSSPRFLLNGHPAITDSRIMSGWWELLPDGTAKHWEDADAFY